MDLIYDVAVIGGGLFGSACAKWAAEDFESTVLIGPSGIKIIKLFSFAALEIGFSRLIC